MNKLILSAFIFFIGLSSFAHFDVKTPVSGDSILSDDVQFELLKELYNHISPKKPLCSHISIKDTQVIQFPTDVKMKNGKYIKANWKEMWSIQACDEIIQIPVSFSLNKKKTKYYYDKSLIFNK